MKKVRRLSALTGLCAALVFTAALPAFSDPDDSTYTKVDGDGVPLSLSDPQAQTSAQTAEQQRASTLQSSQNKDWLVRGYEQQLQKSSPQNQDSNLYFKLSSNSSLARLAGMTEINPENQDAASRSDSAAPSENRNADTTQSKDSTRTASDALKPFITPLGGPSASGIHGLYTLAPDAMVSPFLPSIMLPSMPRSKAKVAEESSDDSLDTPGMTAAQGDVATDVNPPDMSLDLLPGETTPDQERLQAPDRLELTLPPDADQLHKQQDARMDPLHTTSNPASTTTQTKPAPPVENEEDAPVPVSKMQQVTPSRTPIANPFDILNR
jgi:hypothetical protein